MTKVGTTCNVHMIVSWCVVADNGLMKNPQNSQNPQTFQAALRAAFGPGFQAGGPTEATLRLVAKHPHSRPTRVPITV
jgi:hypothetical protein